MIQISQKDKSLIFLILAVLVVLYGVWSAFSYVVYRTTFKHSDVNKIFSQSQKEDEEQWLNVSKNLQVSDLRDRIILLDFWSYSCVSCIQTLQEIKKFEEQFGSKLTVIGVHSANFENEKNFAEIRKAVMRYDIDYPVINDSKGRLRHAFKVKSTPAFVLINPHGNIEKTFFGEEKISAVKSSIKKLIAHYKYELDRDPLPIVLEKHSIDGNVLGFPTKVEYVQDFSYKSRHLPALITANTGKNEIVVSSLSGDVIVKIGSGSVGFEDGGFDVAAFNAPQGLLYHAGKLYVADTGNHALREIDFKDSKVKTLIGSGQKGDVLPDQQIIDAKSFELSSPTDIDFFPNHDSIVIANSGVNQILTYSVSKETIMVLAGNGSKGLVDGKYPHNQLAQTADMSVYNRKLYFVDSESSSLRVLDENGEVKTLIGKGINKSGNKGGKKDDALMQHPMGVFADDTGVYISDSFNHSIRKYDYASGALSTMAGGRGHGSGLGSGARAEFDQPEGITSILNNLYIADANNNRVVTLNRGTLNTSLVDVMPPLKLPKEGFLEYLPNLKKSPDAVVKSGDSIMLKIDLKKGWKINDLGPSFINLLEMKGEKKANLATSFDWKAIRSKTLNLPQLDPAKKYLLQGVIYYCEDKANALCFVNSYEQKLVANTSAESKEVVIKIAY